MHTFCWHVLSNPKVHQRLTAEILQIPSSELVEYEQGLSLPYFQACLKETMRLQPALSANITRMVPKAGAIIDGEFVPGGTQVAVNSWVMHRDETVFGGNTGEFDPDRWLIKDEERLKRMERCMFQVQ